ncbi:hypothetical protein [Brevibacillus laterosporus]|uniref:Cupin domain-containing protein n=1 Tax=Brevibacillus laterosporus TaxID=1465 RepID=A0AAP3DK66_BRELA|nr:hypothetical protein [Brevibacillus laterosporus]MCR8982462.1 hypothetical protein [Brevibacillus laterosporus]MCZ0809618.1 hypothetical protein [Brevibacillus laterosporus]MCZ0828151.1 hypothetical protein [Brevibacillus laterosporus]MCZ0852173.1 hypothetical protein [Brevibacillus laterosporus]
MINNNKTDSLSDLQVRLCFYMRENRLYYTILLEGQPCPQFESPLICSTLIPVQNVNSHKVCLYRGYLRKDYICEVVPLNQRCRPIFEYELIAEIPLPILHNAFQNDKSEETFKPVHIDFDDGIDRIKRACDQVGLQLGSHILTSRDSNVVMACNLLSVDQLPKGFTKWQLPFFMQGGQFFITSADPGSSVSEHSHPDDGVRFIIAGSIFYDGIELSAGDWMFIPKGKNYSFKVGPLGASMFYCYQCCCALLELSQREVINPDYVRTRQSLQ